MKAWLWLLLGMAASAVSWTYMHRVVLPWEHYVNVEHGRLQSQKGDLYPRWVGTRELLLNRRNPYGPEVSHQIQIGFYGHSIEQSYDQPESEIIDEQRFVYPVYVVFLMAPTVRMDFPVLQTWAPVILAAVTALSLWLWIGASRWRPTPVAIAAFILFVLSSPQIAQGLRLRQLGLLVGFLLALSMWALVHKHYFVAGVLLALSTIKPQMVILCLAWLLIWTFGDWKKRSRLAAGFAAAFLLLAGAGELLLPGWPRYFLEGLQAYRKYFPTTSILRLILGNWIGGIVSVLAVLLLLVFAWRRREVTAESPEFVHTLAFFLITTTLVLPLLTPYNQVLLVLPASLLIRDWDSLSQLGRTGFALLIAWPPLASIALLVRPPQLDTLDRTPLLPSALVLLMPFMILWLMYSRRQRLA
jgi:hypothetical protein